MRKVTATTLAALLSFPGVSLAAGLTETGKAAVTLGWTNLNESNDEASDETDDQSYAVFGLSGSYSIPVANNWSIQGDVLAERFLVEGRSVDNVTKLGLAGLHVTYRNPDSYALGLFAGTGFGETNRPQDHSNAWWIGGEAQYYLANTTLYGQVAHTQGDVEDTEEELNSTWMVRGVARHFLTDQSKIEAELAYISSDNAIDGSDDADNLTWGLSYERQLLDSAWYYTAGYRGGHLDTTTEGEELTDHTLYLKMSFQLDGSTLKQNDRNGATLDQPLIALRTVNWLEPLD